MVVDEVAATQSTLVNAPAGVVTTGATTLTLAQRRSGLARYEHLQRSCGGEHQHFRGLALRSGNVAVSVDYK